MAIPSEGLMETRICKKCKEEKNLHEDFYINSGYYERMCKICRNEILTGQYKEYRAVKRKAQREIIKNEVFEAYGGYICACCGETEKKFLQLDHVDNNGAEARRLVYEKYRYAGSVFYKWLYDNNFPKDLNLQILCANCNCGKQSNNGVCPHQTTSNDQSKTLVGSSEPKRNAPKLGDDMVFSNGKPLAVHLNQKYFERWVQ